MREPGPPSSSQPPVLQLRQRVRAMATIRRSAFPAFACRPVNTACCSALQAAARARCCTWWPASVAEVLSAERVGFSYDPVILSGTLELIEASELGIVYRLTGARAVTGP